MNIPLRQKKSYNTKYVLAKTFIQKLKNQKFEEISIKEVCTKTNVCEATFFNYFPQKIDIITYLLKLKLFKIYWKYFELKKNLPITKKIEFIFKLFSKEIKHPYVFFETIRILETNKMKINLIDISQEELQFIFPKCKDPSNFPMKNLKEFFERIILEAINKKEIPEIINTKILAQFLITILKGVPLSTPIEEFSNITEIYQNHLNILWKIFQI